MAAPERVNVAAGQGRLVIKFRRSDLATKKKGELGTRFVLTGRFFAPDGPSFVAEDEVKKNP